ncbi:probable sodium/metabolite cotransporter BASS3, chloroplastic isoform X2 [Selaginella moellendorffii]|uniref:probable sodium/metabolite cotransporter BASS3, chloroplastic isoform X2 n=1 Tax=Selaginella moellendorffii TaxID=88036 RepID=UPI000D1C995E|nr:probable sodium/metabolite cotransporter BASS3, chloroplastic isoform X2 [Selaginella moellendorffii]XP_002976523.2 probable sodium/metabolite cotransporter BASS3, chloroplastic isoform X2 [Selaginella moellendorffii]|eukprot:XP_002973383.2 probable sodium/metabolite cotransporter BASS3, chloroplastic isoform X2 [Selaginella moellendorffii]
MAFVLTTSSAVSQGTFLSLRVLCSRSVLPRGRRRWRRYCSRIEHSEAEDGMFSKFGDFHPASSANNSASSIGKLQVKRDSQGRKIDIAKSLSKMLPYIVVATAAAALIHPATFAWVRKEHYAPALGGIMLSIGVQLSISDFAIVLQRPLPLCMGYVLQYVMKPILGFLVVRGFGVPPSFAAGLILTACVAGAQLSSYAAYLSEGDIALSIMLTSISTITSVIVTPFLTQFLIGSVVPVDVVAMAKSILQVVFLPVLTGLTLNTYAKPLVDRIRPVMPLVAMVCTSLCIGSPLALNQSKIISMEGLQLLFPVLVFHALGFGLGYFISRLPFWRQNHKVSRTLSLCTGMQSSTLAMLLATQFLGDTQAVPPACSVVIMAVMGLTLATWWGKEESNNKTPSSSSSSAPVFA